MVLAGLTALRAAEEKEQSETPDHRDPRLSFKVAFFVPELSVRQTLLAIRSEAERLRQLSDFLPEYVARVKRTTHVRKVAPKNGHGFLTIGAGNGQEPSA